MRRLFQAIKQTVSEFVADGCMSSGAALAYYSIFAIPPLVVLVFVLVSYAGVSEKRINQAIRERLGIPTSAEQLGQMAASQDNQKDTDGGSDANQKSAEGPQGTSLGAAAEQRAPGQIAGIGVVGRVVGVAILLFTATGLFGQLQTSLNRAWGVEPDPERGGVKRFFMKRVLSLFVIIVVVVLLLASTLLSALMNEVLVYVRGAAPTTAVQITTIVVDNLLTLFLATLLFAVIFKILPDVEMAWRDIWVGAGATAALFLMGKILISAYLQRADLGASWGDAAASLVAVLAWFYYTSLIILLGAEFTQVWARQYGEGVVPTEGARRVAKADRGQPQQQE